MSSAGTEGKARFVVSGARLRSRRRPSLQSRFIAIAAIPSLAIFALLAGLTNWNAVLAWIVAWTPVAFLLSSYDKVQARRNRIRVPETSLLVAAAAGGFAGAIGGMLPFRHKTAKLKFWIVSIAGAVLYGIALFATLL